MRRQSAARRRPNHLGRAATRLRRQAHIDVTSLAARVDPGEAPGAGLLHERCDVGPGADRSAVDREDAVADLDRALAGAIGDDLAEGKATLPLIYAMRVASDNDSKIIRDAILEGGLDHLQRITQIIEATGALQYTADKAQEAADKAIASLSGLPASDFKEALINIAEFAVQRRS